MNISYFKMPGGRVVKDQFFPTFEKMVKAMLMSKGQLPQPIASILDPVTQEMIMIHLDFANDRTKMMSLKLIRSLCATMGVKLFCFASEAWMAERSEKDGNELAEKLKNNPEFRIMHLQDRIECLIISYESTEPEIKANTQVTFQMIRDAEEKLLFLKEIRQFNQDSSVKLFGNLINILNHQ
jgi:hypothetical protein